MYLSIDMNIYIYICLCYSLLSERKGYVIASHVLAVVDPMLVVRCNAKIEEFLEYNSWLTTQSNA